jgi:hypothetical protein
MAPETENTEYGRRDPSRWPRGTLYPQKLALTSPTSGGRSVGIVRSQTQTTKFVFVFLYSMAPEAISVSYLIIPLISLCVYLTPVVAR